VAPAPRAAATHGSPAARLEARVERLLRPLDESDEAPATARRWLVPAALSVAAAVAALVGWTHGDLVVRALPFVSS
jgi:hypothetical protein